MAVGCGFITCAKKKEIEFCWDCEEDTTCSRWRHHREFSKQYDTFKCYRKLGDNISFVLKNGIEEFEKQQKAREKLLEKMLKGFNEGRSKTYYSVAATVLRIDELEKAITEGMRRSRGRNLKEKSKILHSLLDNIATLRKNSLKLRKYRQHEKREPELIKP